MEIVSINLHSRKAILETGEVIEIVSLLDSFGEDCFAEDAVIAVCGPCFSGMWYNADLRDFDTVTIN